MGKQRDGYRVSIGSPTLILLFIIICLVTFGMLSLSTAKSEWNMAERNALAVTGYYQADSEGEAFYRMVSEKAEAVCKQSNDPEERRKLLNQELGEYYRPELGIVTKEIAMERSEALYIELIPRLEENGKLWISQWKVILTEDYEIDDSMPVWGGNKTKEQETLR